MRKYIAYPFLYDDPKDLKCDFEILTDEVSSMIGLLRGFVKDEALRDELEKVCEIVYHLNPTLRTFLSLNEEDLNWINERYMFYKNEYKDLVKKFVIPQGGVCACYAHVIRSKCKAVVRMIYRHKENGHEVPNLLFNFFNLLSGYFFSLAIKFNHDEGICEKEFISKNYS